MLELLDLSETLLELHFELVDLVVRPLEKESSEDTCSILLIETSSTWNLEISWKMDNLPVG